MKKLISALLVLTILFTAFSAVVVSAEDVQNYGADNLNNKSGDLIIGYIGGSITEGAGATSSSTRFSTLVVNEYFKKMYPNKNVIERNASIGGTGSGYGMIRMRNDLKLDSAATPDVVFIEFAVNDKGGNSTGLTQNMESMVRQLLSLPKIPAIIFLYTTSSSDNTGVEKNKNLDASIAAHHVVAENYGIYEIDLDKYIWDGIDEGKWIWTNDGSGFKFLAKDTSHVNDDGNRVYADYIIEKLTDDRSEAFVKLDPDTAPCGSYVYGELQEIPLSDSAVKLSSGWKYVVNVPPSDPTQRNSNYPNRFFTNGYYAADNCVDETIELEFTGRGFGIDLNRTKNSGTIKWVLYNANGGQVKSGTHTNYYKTDGGRCCGGMLATNLTYGKYKLVITGALNSTSISDYESSGGSQGGTGTYLGIESIVIEKSMPVISPAASSVKISGNPVVGQKITGSYSYSCKMYGESGTAVSWYASDSANGQYKVVATGDELALTSSYRGKYIKFGVEPANSQGTKGKIAYSDPVYVTRPSGALAFSEDISLSKDGSKNTVKATISNSYEEAVAVTMYAAVYSEEGGVKKLSQVRIITKSVPANGDAAFSLDITVESADKEIAVYAFAGDNLEPVLTGSGESLQYLGVGEGGEDIYKIDRF